MKHLFRFICLAFLSAGLAAAAFGEEGGVPAAREFDHYDFELLVEPATGMLQGTVTVRLPAARQGEEHYLRLLLNQSDTANPRLFPRLDMSGPQGADGSWARVSELEVDGVAQAVEFVTPRKPIFARYALDRLLVRVPAGAKQIRFHYAAKLSQRKGLDDFAGPDLFQSRFNWLPALVNETEAAALSWPFFSYQARIGVVGSSKDAGWEPVRIGRSFAQTGDAVWHCGSDTPVSSLPLVLVGGYRKLETRLLVPDAPAGLNQLVTVYFRPQSEETARTVESIARELLTELSFRYFPLDTRHVSIVQGAPGAVGMAADSLVVVGDGVWDGLNRSNPGLLYRSLYYLLAHELGHLWLGLLAMPDMLSENYLSEGLNELSTLSLYEEKFGRWNNVYGPSRDVLANTIQYFSGLMAGDSLRSQKDWQLAANRRSGWDQALSNPAEEVNLGAKGAIDYAKGFYVAEMSLAMIGDLPAERVLRAYLLDNRYRQVGSEQFRLSLENLGKTDLKPFFAAFVTGSRSLDYSLEGVLNQVLPAAGTSPAAYLHRVVLADQGDAAIRVPTSLAMVGESGTVSYQAVPGPGTYELRSQERLAYVMVDLPGRLLDDNRKNNVWPRQVHPYDPAKQAWLGEYGMNILGWSIGSYRSEASTAPVATAMDLGLGFQLSDRSSYRLRVELREQFGMGLADIAADHFGVGVGLGLGLDWFLPGNVDLGLSLVYDGVALDYTSALAGGGSEAAEIRNRISKVGLSLGQGYQPDMDLGYVPRTQAGRVDWRIDAAVRDIVFSDPSRSVLSVQAGLGAELLALSGARIDLDYQLSLPLASLAPEQKLSGLATQRIPFLDKTVLGIELGGGAILGTPLSLAAENRVLGTGAEAQAAAELAGYHYQASAGAFLGFAAFNNINLSYGNAFLLQSLNLGLRYGAATAFDDERSFVDQLQQAVGLELLPSIRVIGDATISLAIGASLNLTRLARGPGLLENWEAGFYVDAGALAQLAAQGLAY